MGPLDTLNHLLNFLAPALVLGLAVALVAPFFMRKLRPTRGWLLQGALNSLAGLAALVAGLWVFGNDGKMASYALLVVLVATSQWVGGKGWKS
jgi:hypothetical protein